MQLCYSRTEGVFKHTENIYPIITLLRASIRVSSILQGAFLERFLFSTITSSHIKISRPED